MEVCVRMCVNSSTTNISVESHHFDCNNEQHRTCPSACHFYHSDHQHSTSPSACHFYCSNKQHGSTCDCDQREEHIGPCYVPAITSYQWTGPAGGAVVAGRWCCYAGWLSPWGGPASSHPPPLSHCGLFHGLTTCYTLMSLVVMSYMAPVKECWSSPTFFGPITSTDTNWNLYVTDWRCLWIHFYIWIEKLFLSFFFSFVVFWKWVLCVCVSLRGPDRADLDIFGCHWLIDWIFWGGVGG